MNTESIKKIFNLWLDEAQKKFCLQDDSAFEWRVRKPKNYPHFYEDLDAFLRQQAGINITSYRSVKEGYVRVSRPAKLSIDWDNFILYRPTAQEHKGNFRKALTLLDELALSINTADFYSEITQNPQVFFSSVQILNFLIQNPEKGTFRLARQIPHSESTKLIGKEPVLLKLFSYWRGEKAEWKDFYHFFHLKRQISEFRFFAPKCRFEGQCLINFHGILVSSSVSRFDFSDAPYVLIVENKQSFDALAQHLKRGLLIWGSGWRVASLQAYLKYLPPSVYYGGDIDREGYEIFAFLKKNNPKIQSILMSEESLEGYESLATYKKTFHGPFQEIPGHEKVYREVCKKGLLIEQEKIPIEDCLDLLPQF